MEIQFNSQQTYTQFTVTFDHRPRTRSVRHNTILDSIDLDCHSLISPGPLTLSTYTAPSPAQYAYRPQDEGKCDGNEADSDGGARRL